MSTKEPWNNEIYRAMKEESTEMKRHDRGRDESKRPLTTRFLTFLVILMFILVGLAIGFILWNNQVQNTASIAKSFHQSSSVVKTEESTSQARPLPQQKRLHLLVAAQLPHHLAVALSLEQLIQLLPEIIQVRLQLRQEFLGKRLLV